MLRFDELRTELETLNEMEQKKIAGGIGGGEGGAIGSEPTTPVG